MAVVLSAQCGRYGNREAYDGRPVTVTRPDGSTFTQGDTSTYLKTEPPSITPPDGRTSRHEGTSRRAATGSITNTLTEATRYAGNLAFSVRETARRNAANGTMWLVTVMASDGRTATVNRLRSFRAGRGGPWTYGPS